MKVKDVQEALKAGERKFIGWKSTIPLQVLKWGNAYVRYTTPLMKGFISTNIRTFAYSVDGVYKQEGECSSGGGANGVIPESDRGGEAGNKREAGRVPRNGPENKSLRK